MARTNISDLAAGVQVDEVYLVKDSSLAKTKKGDDYIRATISDSTGSVHLRRWDASPEVFSTCYPTGAFVRVRGSVEEYQGKLQVVARGEMPVAPSEVDTGDFMEATPFDEGEMLAELDELAASVTDDGLRALLDAFFGDAKFRERFAKAPAAHAYHHAYVGGLLEHTVSVTRQGAAICGVNDRLDRDLLVTGCLLHDIGKTEELSSEPGFEYTDPGRLLGHIPIGTLMVRERGRKLKILSREQLDLVCHYVLSHHGQREYGAAVVPATAEAVAIHHLDNLDAKVQAASHMIENDPDPAARWTDYSRIFEGKLYKGLPED